MACIYLDHNSTTPLLPEAAEAMAEWQVGQFGNPASQHQVGRRARQRLEEAREEVARIVGAKLSGAQPDRLIFTSGGTEANNLALFGMTSAFIAGKTPGEIVVSAIEHPSISVPAAHLAARGWNVRRLPATSDGVVECASLAESFSDTTRLVSVMLANNETGVIQPVAEIARLAQARGVQVHTDAVQMVGKLPVDFRDLGVSAMTLAAHKFHGPLGSGALIVRHDVKLEPLLMGGFQQQGLRGGTESVALAVGMHVALATWEREQATRVERLRGLRDRLESRLKAEHAAGVVINGAGGNRLPQTLNIALLGCDRQALSMALDLADVACATGSACASGSSELSPVLVAMGCSREVLASSLRFSLGATTTLAEIDEAAARIVQTAARLGQARHPAWSKAPTWSKT